ncbi:MAG: 1-deoxy-D-xylulose-5-phosphate synthase [Oscillospiraceae bacterium]|nr:1-deoxy-D-xylulose-5-phosphate synthase [Oscillospiraceae bacterium]
MILENIKSSADVKALTATETHTLCGELRQAIIENVSKTGGHLASGLGAVELTVAIHRVYDTASDRVIFDVGHQCYAHKMLTGRLDRFGTLRQFGGLSGFPTPFESGDDPCVCGHASVSVSNALGMARARTLRGADCDICAVIGDGALTGGVAYEGLSDCGQSGESIVVILNDNCMSISSNVGGMAKLLSLIRARPAYLRFKRFYRRVIGRVKPLYAVTHSVKEWIKHIVIPDNMFEQMGFYYLGPVDGHDERLLEHVLRDAKALKMPVLLHVVTTKGKGYAPAERDPELYHGVGPFDVQKGIEQTAPKHDFSAAFGEAMCTAAERDGTVAAITAAMESGTGLTAFAEKYPERFFDVGIEEEHAVSMCAGMALNGLKPVFAVYSSFLQRGLDMLIHDVGLAHAHVVFGVDRAGLVGADGMTHQGAFDVGYLRLVPGMTLLSPSNYAELRSMLGAALDADGPVALRYPRGSEDAFTDDTSAAPSALLRTGADAVIISYGIMINEALSAAEILEQKSIRAAVLKLNRLTEPDFRLDGELAAIPAAVVAEDCAAAGCVGQSLAAALAERGAAMRLKMLNLGSGVVQHGSVDALRRACGIDAQAIAAAVASIAGGAA